MSRTGLTKARRAAEARLAAGEEAAGARDAGAEADADESGAEGGAGAPGAAGRPAAAWAGYEWQRDGWRTLVQAVAREDGYDEWGYFVLLRGADGADGGASGSAILGAEARIVPYQEESYYSSQQGVEHSRPVWAGTVAALLDLADRRADPALPARALLPEDHDFAAWDDLYAALRAWRALGLPGRLADVGLRRRTALPWAERKAPLARDVAEEWARRERAAARIQAAFRGWRWRLRVLFNPHTREGAAHLARQWARLRDEAGA